MPPDPTHAQPPPSSTSPNRVGQLLTMDGPTSTRHNHPKSIAYFRVHSWWCTFYGFGQMYEVNSPYRVLSLPYRSSVAYLPLQPYPQSQALATTDLLTVCIVLPFPEFHIVGILQYVDFSDWLLSLRNMYLFPSRLYVLIAHF